MPTSRPNHVSWLCEEVMKLNPTSILDVGIGFGSKGMLFREYTDIWNGRYKDWTTRIDGIEVFPEYVTDLQRKIYTNIYIGHAMEVLDKLGEYDLIYAGDVIEHFDKEEGQLFLKKLKEHGKNIIIATPAIVSKQGAVFGNKHETHLSQWFPEDFKGAERRDFSNVMTIKYTPKYIYYCEGMAFFGERMEKLHGFKKYTGQKNVPVLFLAMYFEKDYEIFEKHIGSKTVFWNGSDVSRLLKNPVFVSIMLTHKAKHYCHNEQLRDELKSVGINAVIAPLFFGDADKYEPSFKPSKKSQVYMVCHPFREKEYGVDTVRRIAPKLPDVTFHIYGVADTSKDNIVYHGQVDEEVMDKEIKEFHGALRLNKHDGFSQTVMKSILMAQYPITHKVDDDDELIKKLNELKEKTLPNFELREKYLPIFINSPVI